jgi:hypothetical protein
MCPGQRVNRNLPRTVTRRVTRAAAPEEARPSVTVRGTVTQPVIPRRSPPVHLTIGEFALEVDSYTDSGTFDRDANRFTRVSGTAWLKLKCAGVSFLPRSAVFLPEGYRALTSRLEVVHTVVHPETQISFIEAYAIDPTVTVGQALDVTVGVLNTRFGDLVHSQAGIIGGYLKGDHSGDILVGFKEVTIQCDPTDVEKGVITHGEAVFPTEHPFPREIHVELGGFSLLIRGVTLRPDGASAQATLVLPASIVSTETCLPATLDLGEISLDPDCDIFEERPEAAFGPWLAGDTGMVFSGTGYTLDLSSSRSPAGYAPGWMGLILASGSADGSLLNPVDSNTGYLAGKYSFTGAAVTAYGLSAQINLDERHIFHPVHPYGYVVSIEAGWLVINASAVAGGNLGPGSVRLPEEAVCKSSPLTQVEAAFTTLVVQPDLDLLGAAAFQTGQLVTWGELTHPGGEVTPWTIEALGGKIYLPAGSLKPFCPDEGTGFEPVSIPAGDLESKGIAGVTIDNMKNLQVTSKDLPSGPADFPGHLEGWLRAGWKGMDGELLLRPVLDLELGDDKREGYVGNKPFHARFTNQEKTVVQVQFVSSAVYDSALDGSIRLDDPCNIASLSFQKMEWTSTAAFVGGDIILPVGGLTLDYWKVKLVPTGNPNQAGVVSVRTGRLVFTAAGLYEAVHFDLPFGLTWAEILADGNLGELFLDFNCYGQAFDKISFTPANLALSAYQAGKTNGYLAVCGTVHFNFFGPAYVNIQDARYDGHASAPYKNRYVTVPTTGEKACAETDLHLEGRVDNSKGDLLGSFDFPNASMGYNETIQDGFTGTGTSELGLLHSDGLTALIEIHHDATDIRLSADSNHDLDLGFYRVGTLQDVAGCIRFSGPLLERIAMWASLDTSTQAGFGVLEPKTGYSVEVNLDITPTSLNFYAAGNILFSVAGSAVDVAASVHLLLDYQRDSAEGDMKGTLDCNSILGGLEGTGQVTWYVDQNTQYLQGRLKMAICSWVAGGSMEGGLFIGNNCPGSKAWVLSSGTEHLSMPANLLNMNLTGLYGYGSVSWGFDAFVLSGGVDIYAGMGAFVDSFGSTTTSWHILDSLPYVAGVVGIYVYGDILGGLVSASAWATLALRGPVPLYFEGKFGLEGCVLWVFCGSVEITAGLDSSGFYLN